MVRPLLRSAVAAVALCLSVPAFHAQDIASFEKKITVKTLPNGLTVLIMERPEAPVFSFYTLVDAGSAQDPKGETGLAHMFEHMAFKGTPEIGTTNWTAEKVALEKEEAAYQALDLEQQKRTNADPQKIKQLQTAFEQAQKDAQQYVVPNQFGQLVESNGGTGLNASTSDDETSYLYSFPSNRQEVWAYLESSRYAHPVFREFYKERDVVVEERRMRTDSRPVGRLVEQYLAAAYTAHPYGVPTVGWSSDVTGVSVSEAEKFFHTYYVPANMTIAVVGDVKASELLPMIVRYFGSIPSGPKAEDLRTVEPPQQSERTVTLVEQTQPFYVEGYHRPDYRDPDDAVYDAISDILSNGRVSRLYRSLVRDKQIAVAAAGFSGLPGTKYPGLFTFYAVPAPGHTPQEMADAIRAEIERLKTQDVSDDELQLVKTRAKADLLRGLADNQGLALQLATYEVRYGDWRELFRQLDRIDKVSTADIRRVANKTFVDSNRTVAQIVNKKQASANAKGTK
jgi:predicted Zn-dependent peptidase